MELECTKDLEQLVSEVIVHEEDNSNINMTGGKELAVIIEENIEEKSEPSIVIETIATEEAMEVESIDCNQIETCSDEPVVTGETVIVEKDTEADVVAKSSESNKSNNETPEQPAAITTAITTIISHFVSGIRPISMYCSLELYIPVLVKY